MSAFDGSAARSFDHYTGTRAPSANPAVSAWSPRPDAVSPALDLQRQLHGTFVGNNPFPELPVAPAEQLLRTVSRLSGYVALGGTVGLIGWLIL
jgi:hypothetical protein